MSGWTKRSHLIGSLKSVGPFILHTLTAREKYLQGHAGEIYELHGHFWNTGIKYFDCLQLYLNHSSVGRDQYWYFLLSIIESFFEVFLSTFLYVVLLTSTGWKIFFTELSVTSSIMHAWHSYCKLTHSNTNFLRKKWFQDRFIT